MPIKEAGKTSVLSRYWRFQWSMLPSLEFDLGNDRDDPYDVDHVLLLHNAPIHSCKFNAEKVFIERYDFDRWILHLSRNPIKRFILNCYTREDGRKPYDVSSSLFSCQDLTHLELSDCCLRLPGTFKGFRMLKSLAVKRVTVLQPDLEKLIASSPLLERLTLCYLKDITGLKIDAPNLQFLKLQGNLQYYVEPKNTLNLVHVSLEPKRAYGKWHRLLTSTSSIRELEISLRSLVTQENEEATSWDFPKLQRVKVTCFSCAKSEVDFIKLLFLSCPALQELEVLPVQPKKQVRLRREENYHLSYSTQLRLLQVTGLCGDNLEIELIKFLLLSSPALQELHILFRNERSSRRIRRLDDDDDALGDRDCTFNQMRFMNIRGFSHADDEVGFIKFLLSRSPMLQHLTLQPQSAKVSWEVSKLLNEIKCNLELLDPLNPSDDYSSRAAARSRSPDYSGYDSYDLYLYRTRRERRYRSPTPFSDSDSDYY
ncbi:PREDICTED: F-box/FBD/LRR-repeat protein At1g13570-like [Fragaria vesca subsp. vesca]